MYCLSCNQTMPFHGFYMERQEWRLHGYFRVQPIPSFIRVKTSDMQPDISLIYHKYQIKGPGPYCDCLSIVRQANVMPYILYDDIFKGEVLCMAPVKMGVVIVLARPMTLFLNHTTAPSVALSSVWTDNFPRQRSHQPLPATIQLLAVAPVNQCVSVGYEL